MGKIRPLTLTGSRPPLPRGIQDQIHYPPHHTHTHCMRTHTMTNKIIHPLFSLSLTRMHLFMSPGITVFSAPTKSPSECVTSTATLGCSFWKLWEGCSRHNAQISVPLWRFQPDEAAAVWKLITRALGFPAAQKDLKEKSVWLA